jgi:hypothetical protein
MAKKKPKPFDPDWSSPPKDTIAELMAEKGFDQYDLAVEMCADPSDIDEASKWYLVLDFIFHLPDEPRFKTSRDTCKRLARSLGGTSQFWWNRFENHRKFLLERN